MCWLLPKLPIGEGTLKSSWMARMILVVGPSAIRSWPACGLVGAAKYVGGVVELVPRC